MSNYPQKNRAETHYRDFIVGVVAGGALGAIAGLLLAQKSGEELREDIAGAYEFISEHTQELAEDIKDNVLSQASDIADQAKDYARHAHINNKVSLADLMEWVSAGIDLWQKIKK